MDPTEFNELVKGLIVKGFISSETSFHYPGFYYNNADVGPSEVDIERMERTAERADINILSITIPDQQIQLSGYQVYEQLLFEVNAIDINNKINNINQRIDQTQQQSQTILAKIIEVMSIFIAVVGLVLGNINIVMRCFNKPIEEVITTAICAELMMVAALLVFMFMINNIVLKLRNRKDYAYEFLTVLMIIVIVLFIIVFFIDVL